MFIKAVYLSAPHVYSSKCPFLQSSECEPLLAAPTPVMKALAASTPVPDARDATLVTHPPLFSKI